MKLFKLTIILCLAFHFNAQKTPTLYIDGTPIKFQSDLSLPYWISSGKTIDFGLDAISASILEFNVLNNEMVFNQVIHLTALGTVPSGKIWKIEAIGIGNNLTYNNFNNFSNSTYPSIFTSPVTFSNAGTFNWTVPPGITNICIEIWGGGGTGGNGGTMSSGANGGGGYGFQCFNVSPGSTLTLVVGNSGQQSSVGSLIYAYPGLNGANGTTSPGLGGTGGISSSTYYVSGENGLQSGNYALPNVRGGNGGNGGNGASTGNASAGIAPGGGGGGGAGSSNSSYSIGATGAKGQIKIYF